MQATDFKVLILNLSAFMFSMANLELIEKSVMMLIAIAYTSLKVWEKWLEIKEKYKK